MTAKSPEQIHPLFAAAYNRGDTDGLLAFYEPQAAFVPEPGQVVRGSSQIREAVQGFLDLKGRLEIATRVSSRSRMSP